MGMTVEQYWDGDPMLTVFFRRAEKIRNEKRNQELWLQGMYIYEAIGNLSPILHAFAKKGTKPRPYPSEPYSLTKAEEDAKAVAKEKKIFNKGKAMMEKWMLDSQKKFRAIKENNQEVKTDG